VRSIQSDDLRGGRLVAVGPGIRPTTTEQPHTTVLLPAYNEELGLGTVLGKLRSVLDAGFEILVVDDGSQDETAAVADAHGCRVVRHTVNRGKGRAMQTGFAHAQGSRVITMDADDTYPAEAVPFIAAALDQYEMVVGTRQTGRFNISPLNRLGNAVFRQVISVAAGRAVSDPLTGFYGMRRTLIDRLSLTSEGFGIEAEIMIKTARLNASTLEIPIVYGSRIGSSKLNPVRDGLIIGRTILAQSMVRTRVPVEVAGTVQTHR
jgi:glycosyltransferase involved in cell wall biosynthesis